MIRVTWRTSGDWSAFADRLPGIADAVVQRTALGMEARAKINIQRVQAIDTGNLRSSVQARRVGPAHWRVTVGAEYGAYVEYGTRHMRARPYFGPAFDQMNREMAKAMEVLARA